MTKTLYILRHGETEFNKLGMVQGSGIDAPLNETGRRQAAAFYERYGETHFDKIYTSNLIRTHQTVQQFIDKDIPHQVLDGLREISWGNQEGVAFTPETSTVYQQTCKKWAEGDVYARIAGGESPVEVAERQKQAFEIILSGKEGQVLICTHGRAIRVMLCWMLGYPLSLMDHFQHANTGLYVVQHTGSSYSVTIYNETTHLSTLVF